MLLIPLVILLILYFMYCLLMRYESRTFMEWCRLLWSFTYDYYYSLLLCLLLFRNINQVSTFDGYRGLLVAVAVLVILFFPLATIIMFFVEGIKVIKHED